jgi:hypothetical protein
MGLYPDLTVVTTASDATGRFSLAVPPGKYVVSAEGPSGRAYYSARGPQASLEDADSLVLDERQTCVRADFIFGVLDIDLRAPEAWEGERLVVRCHRAGAYLEVRDGQASITLPAMVPGTFPLRVYDPSGSTRMWLPRSDDPSVADSVTVESGRVTSYVGELPRPAVIRGTVEGAWRQMGAEPPTVMLYDADSMRVASVGADSSGAFEFMLFASGGVRLLTRIGQFSTWLGGETFGAAAEFELVAGQEISGLTVLDSGIWGRIVEPGGQNPGTVAVVFLTDEYGDPLGKPERSADGIFRFPNLPLGIYHLYVGQSIVFRPDHPWPGTVRAIWFPQWYDRANSFSMATPLELRSEGEGFHLVVPLEEGGRILGSVADAFGAPVGGAYLRCTRDTTSDNLFSHLTTRGDGSFTIAALPDGRYKVGAFGYYGQTTWYPGTADWDSAGAITIEDHQEVTDLEIVLLD